MTTRETRRRWPTAVARYLRKNLNESNDHIDASRRRLRDRLRLQDPRHIAAYRGFDDGRRVEFSGRVMAGKPAGGPDEEHNWWHNLLNTYRRFDSDKVPGVGLKVRFRDAETEVTTDQDGYYCVQLENPGVPAADSAWDQASVSLLDGTLATPQPVLQVSPRSRIGIISDIDDTVLHTGISSWKTAAQLTFLQNARTRKPLPGVAALYTALEAGMDATTPANPVFYVSSSPWNLYDLLEDFLELNAIPAGPIFLRGLGPSVTRFLRSQDHGHKLERTRDLVQRMPHLRWVLLGDSGQADAEIYAEVAREFGDRIAAVYIRDVNPGEDSPLDAAVDGHIEAIAGTHVPMMRVHDSMAVAEHSASLGLIDPAALPGIASEVGLDYERPTLGEAALQEAME